MRKSLDKEVLLNRLNEYSNNTLELISEYKNRRTKITVKCKKCGYIFDFSPARLYGNVHFKGCPKCIKTVCICSYCGKNFKKYTSALSESGLNFCSKDCGNVYKNKIKINTQDSINYRRNAFLKYPHKCAICGYNDDERILEAHHIDSDRTHNDVNNLIILCPNCHKKLTLNFYKLSEDKTKLINNI